MDGLLSEQHELISQALPIRSSDSSLQRSFWNINFYTCSILTARSQTTQITVGQSFLAVLLLTETITYHIYVFVIWFVLLNCCQTQAWYTHSSLIPSGFPITKSSSKHAWISHIWRSSKTRDSSPDSLHNFQQLYISFLHLELMTGNKMPVFPGTGTHCKALSHHAWDCYRPNSASYVRSKHFTRSTTWKERN